MRQCDTIEDNAHVMYTIKSSPETLEPGTPLAKNRPKGRIGAGDPIRYMTAQVDLTMTTRLAKIGTDQEPNLQLYWSNWSNGDRRQVCFTR